MSEHFIFQCPHFNNIVHIVSVNEMKDIILPVKSKISRGIDGIPTSIIRHCVDDVPVPLNFLVNQPFLKGMVRELKTALVKPLYKKRVKNEVTNYRPISNVTGFSKICEKAYRNRLLSLFDKFDVIYINQQGFRKNKSIDIALFEYVQNIFSKLDDK